MKLYWCEKCGRYVIVMITINYKPTGEKKRICSICKLTISKFKEGS